MALPPEFWPKKEQGLGQTGWAAAKNDQRSGKKDERFAKRD
jgi:hypothetical protein